MDQNTAVNRFKRQHTDFTGTFCVSEGYISSRIILKIGFKGIMFFMLQSGPQRGWRLFTKEMIRYLRPNGSDRDLYPEQTGNEPWN